MSSYKNNNKGERKEIHQEETKSQQLEMIKTHKTKAKANKTRTYLWNQHIYDGGTWTKAKMKKEGLLDQMLLKDNDSKQSKETNPNNSWNTIVDTTPQHKIPNQLITSEHSSLSSLTVNNTEQKRGKRKDKVDEYLQSWELKRTKNIKIKKLKTKDSNTNQSSIQSSSATNQLTYERKKSSTSDVSLAVATDRSMQETTTVIKKRLPIFTKICKQMITTTQKGLKSFGFKQKITTNKTTEQKRYNNSIQTPLNTQTKLKENRYKGDKLTKLDQNHTRLFYLNINGIDTGNGDHSLLQLCHNLQEEGVDVISLTETNVHWKRQHVTSNFKRIVQETWPEDKIGICTSESNISWNSDYKPGGTAMISLNKVTSATINKGEDPSGLGRWTFMTLLGKNNSRTSIFNM